MSGKIKPWEPRWKIVDNLSGGGQADTLLVVHRETGQQAVLKKLKNQKDPERRARMFREVVTLISLSHPGLPEILDSNIQEFKNINIPLFCVMEYIEGGTLESNIDRIGVNIDSAVDFIRELSSVLHYCHEKGIIHRDIKPDNIILREGNLCQPVLIDFGLTFNKEIEAQNPTPEGQHIGNRFLILPELTIAGSNKRDPRSDITNVVGILFYLLTKQYPTNLSNENGSMPHQRAEAKEALKAIDKEKLRKINILFDTGFQYHINDRFQTLEQLEIHLQYIMEPKDIEVNVEELLASINMATPEAQIQNLEQFEQAHNHFETKMWQLMSEIVAEIKGFSLEISERYPNYIKRTLVFRFNIFKTVNRENFIQFAFVFRFEGSEALLDLNIWNKGQTFYEKTIHRYNIEDEFNTDEIKQEIREKLIIEITKFLET